MKTYRYFWFAQTLLKYFLFSVALGIVLRLIEESFLIWIGYLRVFLDSTNCSPKLLCLVRLDITLKFGSLFFPTFFFSQLEQNKRNWSISHFKMTFTYFLLSSHTATKWLEWPQTCLNCVSKMNPFSYGGKKRLQGSNELAM